MFNRHHFNIKTTRNDFLTPPKKTCETPTFISLEDSGQAERGPSHLAALMSWWFFAEGLQLWLIKKTWWKGMSNWFSIKKKDETWLSIKKHLTEIEWHFSWTSLEDGKKDLPQKIQNSMQPTTPLFQTPGDQETQVFIRWKTPKAALQWPAVTKPSTKASKISTGSVASDLRF